MSNNDSIITVMLEIGPLFELLDICSYKQKRYLLQVDSGSRRPLCALCIQVNTLKGQRCCSALRLSGHHLLVALQQLLQFLPQSGLVP